MTAKLEISRGHRFGRLVVVREGPPKYAKKARTLICRCDCGAPDRPYLLDLLVRGTTRSCGCLRREAVSWQNGQIKKTHGMRRHELYATWCAMRARCGNPANPGYRSYGARGISVYPAWQDFAVFVRDVEAEIGPRPAGILPSGRPVYSLDRENVDGNYEPGNIRWGSWREQALNQRKVHELSRRVVELEDQVRRLTAEVGALTAELEMERRSYR